MRRHFLFIAIALLTYGFIRPATNTNALPAAAGFDSTMTVHLYHGGGMAYMSDNAYIRFDSCVYVRMERGKETRTAWAMTPEKRQQVMGWLKQYHFYNLKQDNKNGITHDKATTQICVENKGNISSCVMSSASTEVREKDRSDFISLYDVLMEFASKK